MKYKRVETKNGRVQYFVNGTMASPKKIDASILNQLEGNMELEITPPEPEQQPAPPETPRTDWKCFIDGQPAKYKKFLELQTVYLCDEHQNTLTTGEVVFHMRESGLL